MFKIYRSYFSSNDNYLPRIFYVVVDENEYNTLKTLDEQYDAEYYIYGELSEAFNIRSNRSSLYKFLRDSCTLSISLASYTKKYKDFEIVNDWRIKEYIKNDTTNRTLFFLTEKYYFNRMGDMKVIEDGQMDLC